MVRSRQDLLVILLVLASYAALVLVVRSRTEFLTLQCSLSQPSLLVVASFGLRHLQESPQVQFPAHAQLGLVHAFLVSIVVSLRVL